MLGNPFAPFEEFATHTVPARCFHPEHAACAAIVFGLVAVGLDAKAAERLVSLSRFS